MFENYSVADLVANIYKKRIVNIVALVLIFCIIAVPYTYKALSSKTIIKENTNYSSYVSYKITSPVEEQQNFNKNKIGGYGDFYGKLIESNLNGAFLFNDLTPEDMSKVSSELDTGVNTLKNSNFDFWDKKIVVNPLVNNAGVTVKILTSSKLANDIIERKLDSLIDKFKDTYSDVKIEKLDTINSQEVAKATSTTSGVNKISLLIRLVILGVGAVINRAGDYSKYGINFITKLDSADNFKEIIQYKNGKDSLVLLGSNKNVLSNFSKKYGNVLTDNITIGDIDNIKDILIADSVLFVEEYGITRYKNFEETLQVVQNLNKKVLGIATYKL